MKSFNKILDSSLSLLVLVINILLSFVLIFVFTCFLGDTWEDPCSTDDLVR